MKDVMDICSKRLTFGMFGRNNIFRSALKQQNMAPLDIGKQEGRVGQQNDLELYIGEIVVQPVRQNTDVPSRGACVLLVRPESKWQNHLPEQGRQRPN